MLGFLLCFLAALQVLSQDLPVNTLRGYQTSAKGSHFVWKRKADLPEPLSDFAIATRDDINLAYITGGCNSTFQDDANNVTCQGSNRIYIYDPRTDQYSMILMKDRRFRHAAVVVNKKLIIHGGRQTNDFLVNSTEIYDFDAKTCKYNLLRSISSETHLIIHNLGTYILNGPPIFDMAAFKIKGDVFMTGGYNDFYESQDTTYQFNFLTNTWVTLASKLNQNRGDLSITTFNNLAYAVGGWTSDNNFTLGLSSIETFDPDTKSWTLSSTDEIRPGRGDSALCNIRSRLFLFGGEYPSNQPHDEVEVLSLDYSNPESNDWHYAGELPTFRYRLGCASLNPSSIHVFGGQTYRNRVADLTTHRVLSQRVEEFTEVRVIDEIETRVATFARIAGTANVNTLVTSIGAELEAMARSPVRITYRTMDSGVAISQFSNSSRDDLYFSDVAIPSSIYTSITSETAGQGHKIVQLPIVLSTVRVYVNLPTQVTQQMGLNACQLARIYSTPNLTWGSIFPSGPSQLQNLPIVPVRQSDTSSMTIAFVNYLEQKCRAQFVRSAFFNVPVALTKSPNNDVPGSILYAYPSHLAAGIDFTEMYLKNAFGVSLVGSTSDPTLSLPRVIPDFSGDLSQDIPSFLTEQPNPASWPIVTLTYAYVRQDQTELAQTGQLIVAFLKYLFQNAAQKVSALGYVPLPSDWYAAVTQALTLVKAAGDSSPYNFQTVVLSSDIEPDYSFSSTRSNYYLLQNANLDAKLKLLNSKITAAAPTQPPTPPTSSFDTTTYSIAVAALIIAILSFLLALFAACRSRKVGKHEQQPGINQKDDWVFRPNTEKRPHTDNQMEVV